MDKQLTKKIISYYQSWVSKIELVDRSYVTESELNYVFVGLRRAGKSYLVYQQIQRLIAAGHKPEEILYFNFEDDRVGSLQLSELDGIKLAYEEMYDHKPIFFLDEVQLVAGWEKFARRLADTGYRVYITGSNAKMLSSEIATTLGGRYVMVEVFPFSFTEYLAAYGLDTKQKNAIYKNEDTICRHFDDYFHFGGLPELQKVTDKRTWTSGLYGRIFFGDMVARHSIRNEFALRLLVKKLAESVLQPSSYRRMANLITSAGKNVSVDTVIDYIGYMVESWLILPFENYCAKLSDKEMTKKYYFVDNGILNLFLVDNSETILLENIVAIALRKKYVGDVFFYNDKVEVDFVVPSESLAVQVSYSLSNPETRQREVRALEKLSSRFDFKRRLIVTRDEEDIIPSEHGDIEVVPAWKWLLSV